MALTTSCATFATLTSFTAITTTFPTTSFVQETITAEPTTSAIGTTTTCLGFDTPIVSGLPSTCTLSSVSTQFTTIPGGVRTTSSPVVGTVTSVSTRGTTLFGTSCTTINGGGNNNGNGNNGNNGNGNNGPSGGPSDNGSGNGNGNQNSGPTGGSNTTIVSQAETTLPNGQISTVMTTITSHIPNSTVYVGQSQTPDTQQNSRANDMDGSLGPIIGGTVGGFFGLLFLALAIWLFINRRRKRWDDVFEKTTEEYGRMGNAGASMTSSGGKSRGRFSLGQDLEDEPGPKPYQYGIIGQPLSSMSSKNNNGATTSQSKTSPAMMSRPSTAGSNYPLMGHHTTASSSSNPNTPNTPMYPNATGAATPSPYILTTTIPLTADEPQVDGYFGPRAGSPVSFSEGRRLQVTNGSPPSIYGDQSLHQRMMSDGSEPSTPMDTPLTRSAVNVAATGADTSKGRDSTIKGRKSSLPPPENRGVLVSEDGPPKLILNL